MNRSWGDVAGVDQERVEIRPVALGQDEVEVLDRALERRRQPIGGQQPDRHPADQPRRDAGAVDLGEQTLRLGVDVGLDRRCAFGHGGHHPTTN